MIPKISIVIATFNRAPYLVRGLERLSRLDYPNLEVVVIDGGSSDETVELLKERSNLISYWISEPDKGEYDALNKGIKASTGEVIKLLTDDDVIRNDGLRAGGDYFEKFPDTDILFGQCDVWMERDGIPVFDHERRFLDPKNLLPERYFQITPGPPSISSFIHRRTFDKIGYFSTEFYSGDYEYWARAMKAGCRFGLIPNVVVDYHLTGVNTVTKRESEIRTEMIRYAELYGSSADVRFWKRKKREADNYDRARNVAHRVGIHPFRWAKKVLGRGDY